MKHAAGILFRDPDCRILLLHRSEYVRNPGVWNLPGGLIDPGETPKQAAIREAREETGITVHHAHPRFVKVIVNPYTHTRYHLFTSCIPALVPILNQESDDWAWVYPEEMKGMQLHPGLRDIDW